MNLSRNIKNESFIQEAIFIILSLFNARWSNSNYNSIKISQLSENEKKILISILKTEIT